MVLAALVDRKDFSSVELTRKDRLRLQTMIVACRNDLTAMAVQDADQSLKRL